MSCAITMSGLTCSAAVADYDGETALANAKADITNWMKYLPDDMFAAHVSIPGSHDSATGHNVSLPTLSMAQEVLLEDQLKGGIRAFDFRPGFYSKTETIDGEEVTTYYINCNHGASKTEES